MGDLLQPKPIEIEQQDGTKKIFIISKFPAVQGREILTKYPLSAIPKLSEYRVSEDTMFKLMAFVGIENNGATLRLTTPELINNHCSSWEVLAKIELAMLEYNCSFFLREKLSTFFKDITVKVPPLISQILMGSLAQSSTQTKPPSMNSEQSTPSKTD